MGGKAGAVMAHIYKRPNTPTYRIQYRDENRRIRDVRGFSNLAETKAEAARLEDEVTRIKRGILDPRQRKWQAAEIKPIEQHLADWKADIIARGATAVHAKLLHSRAARVLAACREGSGVDRISQLDPVDVQGVIKKGLDAGGAHQTAFHYVAACRQFSKWLASAGVDRSQVDRLASVKKPRVTEFKHARGEVPAAACIAMINRLEADGARRWRQPGAKGNMTATERAWLYRLALATGLRKRALGSLTPESFDLTAMTVKVEARAAKNGKAHVVPIPDAFASGLTEFLQDKPPGVCLFDIPDVSARMLRHDLAAAGVQLPADGLARDFHSLRHTALSMLGRAGADLKTVQSVADHSTPTLTGLYMHTTDDASRRVINAAWMEASTTTKGIAP
jgi:integrase